MRPNSSVMTASAATTAKFVASSAGRNWIFATQPSYASASPVKSRNSNDTAQKNSAASDILSLRIIIRPFVCSGRILL